MGLCRRGGGRRLGVVRGQQGGLLVLGVVGGQGVVGVVDLGRATEEPVAEVADFGLQECNLGFETVFALAGALVEGLVKGGVVSGVDQRPARRLTGRGLLGRGGGGGRGAGGGRGKGVRGAQG